MKSRRSYSIANLIHLVFLCGVGFAALRTATALWESVAMMLVTLSLSLALALAIVRTGQKRAYWVGFIVFGGVYFAMTNINEMERNLPTSRLLAHWASQRYPQTDIDDDGVRRALTWLAYAQDTSSADPASKAPNQAVDLGQRLSLVLGINPQNSNGVVRVWDASTGQLTAIDSKASVRFYNIGQYFCALALGFIGAWWIRWLYDRETQRQTLAETQGAKS